MSEQLYETQVSFNWNMLAPGDMVPRLRAGDEAAYLAAVDAVQMSILNGGLHTNTPAVVHYLPPRGLPPKVALPDLDAAQAASLAQRRTLLQKAARARAASAWMWGFLWGLFAMGLYVGARGG